MTSTEEYNTKVILDGIMVKRENHTLKETIISPELSMNSIATHRRDKLLSIVRVQCFLGDGQSKELLGHCGMPRHGMASLSDGGTHNQGIGQHKPWLRLLMEWVPENYSRLTIKHGIVIDMSSYPDGKLFKPKLANAVHLHQVLDGWKGGRIKWVRLSADQLERKREELAGLTLNAASNAEGTTALATTESNSIQSNAIQSNATQSDATQCDATQFSTPANDQVETAM
ncbi:uncharacterized protein EI90DRAFT_3018837 [Cantharellus anzutake]|uniref:uncharacterized protein n=1 Tax=Cantharellus anzutake TaxID=1750568 RepID=UPI00190639F4|nr:uncharacterized protein EI90DRAFT_3018837 [Cantharellus anzutake]KAF8325751.1 hypothetical protein EI90DRAFT_3018837 [Cantharellus anzutake]